MVHFCCVPGCSNENHRESNLSYFRLPLKQKKLLKSWIHRIGRKNLPINGETRVCSKHFVNAKGRLLRPNEVPSLNLPITSSVKKKRKTRKERRFAGNSVCADSSMPTEENLSPDDSSYSSVGTQTETMYTSNEVSALLQEIASLREEVAALKEELDSQSFWLENVKDDESKVLFYTGFQSYGAFARTSQDVKIFR